MLVGMLLMYIGERNGYPLLYQMASWVVTIIGTAKFVLKFMGFMSGVKEGYGKSRADKGV